MPNPNHRLNCTNITDQQGKTGGPATQMRAVNKLLWGIFGTIVSFIYKNDALAIHGLVALQACASTYGDNSVCNGYGAYSEPDPISLCANSQYYYTGKLSSGAYNELNTALCKQCPSPGYTKLIKVTAKYTKTFCGETAPLPPNNASSFGVTVQESNGNYAFMKTVSQGGATVKRSVYCRYTLSTSSVLASDTDKYPNLITSCYVPAGVVSSEMPGHEYRYTSNCDYK